MRVPSRASVGRRQDEREGLSARFDDAPGERDPIVELTTRSGGSGVAASAMGPDRGADRR